MPAIADIEIASLGRPDVERRPADALVRQRGAAVVARRDPMAARGQRLGERDKGGLGAAERPRLGGAAVEGDAPIGHHHVSHHSLSSRAFR
jgi:hypothetical protein